jgi:preprotein translocase subunit SecD
MRNNFLSNNLNIESFISPLISVCIVLSISGCNQVISADIPFLTASSNIKSSLFCPFKGTELTFQTNPQSIDEVRRVMVKRIENLKSNQNTSVAKITANQLLVQLPGETDPEFAAKLLGGSALLEFRKQKAGSEGPLVAAQGGLAELEQKKEQAETAKDNKALEELLPKIQASQKTIASFFDSVELTGDRLTDAFGQPRSVGTQDWVVIVKFDSKGADLFAKLTKEIAGTGRGLGIFLDNRLLSAPRVDIQYAQTGIAGGSAEISGSFDAKAANEIAIQLRSGTLPAPTQLVRTSTAKRDRCETQGN